MPTATKVKAPEAPRPVTQPQNGKTPDRPAGLPVPRRTGLVPVPQITRDERVNTRPVDEAWVKRRVDSFRPEALGLPAVSLRADGTYVVLDGQNRVALCRAAGADWQPIECQIYEGLDLAQEAGLFVLLNDGRAPKAIHKFLARITEGEEIATQITQITEQASWRIAANGASDVIMAVVALEKLHKADLRRNKGQPPTVLAATLTTIAKAWGHVPSAQHEAIIGGIGALYLMHGPAIDQDSMVKQLAGCDGGPETLYRRARGLREARGGNVANCVAELVTDIYNKGKKARRLPKFQ
jgi:Family of unknown function (DUF6551)